jgi:hypothetical protein
MEQVAFSERIAQSGLFAFTVHGRLRRYVGPDKNNPS